MKKGHPLPKREQAFLDGARSAGLKERPDVRGMLDMLDRAEVARGGTAYWASQLRRPSRTGGAADFLHDPFMGRRRLRRRREGRADDLAGRYASFKHVGAAALDALTD